MSDTTQYTLSDSKKEPVGKTLHTLKYQQEGMKNHINKIETWRTTGHPDSPNKLRQKGVDDHIDTLYFRFKILWIVAGVLGTLSTIILSWLLAKI